MKTTVCPGWLASALAGLTFSAGTVSGDITLTNANASALLAALNQGGSIRCAFNGTVTLTTEVVLRTNVLLDAGSNAVTLAAPTATNQASFRLFTVPAGVRLTLLNLTLANGFNAYGGAVSNNGTLVASNCVFDHNWARGADGADGSNGANKSGTGDAGGGGGFGGTAAGGALFNLGTASIERCLFRTNVAQAGSGGNGGNGGDGGFQGGRGGDGGYGAPARGGAIYSLGTLTVTNSWFQGNYAYGGDGGLGGTNGSGSLTSYPGRGGAGQLGAGAAIYTGGPALVAGCTFNGNVALAGNSQGGGEASGRGVKGPDGASAYGGAICNVGPLTNLNSTFVSNQVWAATGGNGGTAGGLGGDGGAGGNAGGGGLYNSGSAWLRNCTFAGGSVIGGTNGLSGGWPAHDGVMGAGYGAAVDNTGGYLELKNTILDGPVAGANVAGEVSDGGYNLNSDGSLSLASTNSRNYTNSLLSALADNGGPTPTMALQAGSPAIDAADPASCLPYDQRGWPRFGTRCDIGAYEFPYSAIRGRITLLTAEGPGVTNVTLELVNTNTALSLTTLSDTNGDYAFTLLAEGSNYVITPQVEGYVFSPTRQQTNCLGADVTNVNFIASPLLPVLGRVVDAYTGLGIEGVDIFSEENLGVTDTNGAFELRLPAGTWTVLPDLLGYTFDPLLTMVTVTTSGVTNLLFRADGIYALSGRIMEGTVGVAGVTVSNLGRVAQTDADGYYTIESAPPGTNVLVPTKTGYVFSPASYTVEIDFDSAGFDFAARHVLTLSGTVRAQASGSGLAGVIIAVTNPVSTNIFTTTTDANGTYSLEAPAGTNTVIPARVGFGFDPAFTNVIATTNVSGVDFAGFPALMVSGSVFEPLTGVSNVSIVARSGTRTNEVFTTGSGLFTLSNLPPQTYTLTPTRAGYTFDPPSTNVTLTTANLSGLQFKAVGANLVTGRVTNSAGGVSNVLISVNHALLSGGRRTAVTDPTGAYVVSNLPPRVYEVVPTKAKTYFFPTSLTNLDLTAGNGVADFRAALSYTLNGRVTDGTNPVGSVMITVTNPVVGRAYVVTNADTGYYAISVPEGTNTVTAFRAGNFFTPDARTNNVSANLYGLDFLAARGYLIGGSISTPTGLIPTNSGVTNLLVHIGSYVVRSGAGGRYQHPSLPPGQYVVQPEATNFLFSPSSSVITVPPDTNSVNFTPTPVFTISGTVSAEGVGLQGVSVAFGTNSATTDAGGNYQLAWLVAQTNNLIPTKPGYTFSPGSSQLVLSNSNLRVDFVATRFYTISGKVSVGTNALAGVLMTFGASSNTTGADGTYRLAPLAAQTNLLVPSKAGYVFEPPSLSLALTTNDLTTNFVATRIFTLSGTVSVGGLGLEGVMMTFGTSSNLTGSNGAYQFTGLVAQTNQLVPSKAGYAFTPAAALLFLTNSDLTTNFLADRLSLLSGYIRTSAGLISSNPAVSNIAVHIGSNLLVFSGANGFYQQPNLPSGQYLVQPEASNVLFTPISRLITLPPDTTNVDFVLTPVFTVSGTVTAGGTGLAGVTMTFGTNTATTQADGTYRLAGLLAQTNDLTPSKQGYHFSPAARHLSLTQSAPQQDFVSLFTIRGSVWEYTNPVPQIVLLLSNSSGLNLTSVTDSNGLFGFEVLAPGTYGLRPLDPVGVGFRPPAALLTVGGNVETNFYANAVTARLLRLGTNVSLLFTGLPARPYLIQTAPRLATNQGSPWSTLIATNADATGGFQYLEPHSNSPARFYRGTPRH